MWLHVELDKRRFRDQNLPLHYLDILENVDISLESQAIPCIQFIFIKTVMHELLIMYDIATINLAVEIKSRFLEPHHFPLTTIVVHILLNLMSYLKECADIGLETFFW